MIMLLFIILFVIEFSSIEQCSLSNYCTCSTDLTIVKCTDRQLTNEFLLKMNRVNPWEKYHHLEKFFFRTFFGFNR